MKENKKPRARYGSGSLYQRGDIWHVQYREVKHLSNGKTDYVRHRVSTHSSDRDFAQRFLNKKLQEIGGRRHRKVDPDELTYEDLRDAYLAESVEKGLRSVRRGKISSFTRLDKFFGGWYVKDFSVTGLKQFRQECRRTGLTDATTNRCIAALRRMFNLAVENELLTAADLPGYFPMVKEPDKNPKAIFIKDEWYEPLRKALTEPLRSAFVLCYHTGLRVHEMLRLHWRDVDLKRHLVTLPGEITKSGEPRTVFLHKDFGLKAGDPDKLVFPLGDTRGEWHGVCVRLGIGSYRCRECGATFSGKLRPAECTHRQRDLSYQGPLLRHTRHTAIRNMDEAGITRDRAKAITGHKTDSVYSRYNIGKEGDVERARLALEAAHQKRQARLRK